MTPTLAEIRIFAGNFAPRQWALCYGQLVSISQQTALFSLLGTAFGGDGRTSFGYPDLRGRMAVGSSDMGTGPGVTTPRRGQVGGQQTHTLILPELGAHVHPGNQGAAALSANAPTTNNPTGNQFTAQALPIYTTNNNPNLAMAADSVTTGSITLGNTGGGQSHENMSPFIVMNYIICIQGVFPSRN